jgi:hypothetical protein
MDDNLTNLNNAKLELPSGSVVAAGSVLGRTVGAGTGPVQELPIAVDASGNVGIGTSAPLLNKLVVQAALSQITATDGAVSQAVGYANINLAYSGTFSNHGYSLITNNAERMRITETGNVGIGISSPFYKLVVSDTVNGNLVTQVANASAGASANAISQLWVNGRYVNQTVNANSQYFQTMSDGIIISYTDFDTHIWRSNAGTERMRIEASGNVGIGTSAPFGYGAGYTSVAVNGSTSGLIDWLANGVRYGTAYNIGAGFAIGNATANPVYFLVNNVERMRIGGDGKVAIGTATPDASAILDVTSTTGGVLFPRMTTTQRDAIGSPANGLVLYNTTTNKLQVRAAGAWVDLH